MENQSFMQITALILPRFAQNATPATKILPLRHCNKTERENLHLIHFFPAQLYYNLAENDGICG
jgi:hypothetical protein